MGNHLFCIRFSKSEISNNRGAAYKVGSAHHWRYSSLRQSWGCPIWRSSLKESGKKIKMWEKYNKKVTNRGEKHQWSWMPFLGHYLTPSGFQQRKPQMEKNLTGCHKCLRTPVPEDPRGHLGSWPPATQEEMGIQRGQVCSGDIQQVCLELFRSQAPGNWLPDHPIHHCTTHQAPLLPTLPGISGSLQIGGQTQQGCELS